ncbi:protein artichoke-like [Paramacrobiotus metropolitanus]|uniref:protein artichoke-like n=1 Tax=Paramacrobiotus metropolitanus TaxID=2943436 RepID=UPI0024459702|nr:protein artichoke-like [Paramacrobiotus metropolitanus]
MLTRLPIAVQRRSVLHVISGLLIWYQHCPILPIVAGDDICPPLYNDTSDGSTAVLAGDSGYSENHDCQLDCYREDDYDIICEAVNFNDLIALVKSLNFPDKTLNMLIWNSPSIIELESGVFRPIRHNMNSLHIFNLTNLVNFPVLRESKIRTLKIELAPGVTQFNAELLPAEIERIILLQTGINQLSVDLQEVTPLQNVKMFVFVGHSITTISDNFLNIFPNLESMTFADNVVTISVSDIPDQLFTTRSLLKHFIFTNNSFNGSHQYVQENLMETIIENLNLANNSVVVDLSNNNLPTSKDAKDALASINTTKTLSFSGNQFGQLFKATNMFTGFDLLEELDLSNTVLPKQIGLFQGLGALTTLNLAGNMFRDLARIDIFDQLIAPLVKIDLSNNILMALPKSAFFANITIGLKELLLSGNKFHSELIAVSSPEMYPSPFPPELQFPNLTTLDLSQASLQIFNGSWISEFSSLRQLDLSCNKFEKVTENFFKGLPESLEVLLMNFCSESMQKSPKFTDSAFATLGNYSNPRLKQLSLQTGYFKTWILKRLLAIPEATKKSLKFLDLSKNQIKYLSRDSLTGYPYLEKLHLGENAIQTIGPNTFSDLFSLRWLNLSSNFIVSVQVGEFTNLPNLTFLDLSNNGMLNIGQGSLNSLTALTNLYLGRNKLQSYIGMFTSDASNLVHLSLARNPLISLNTYPIGCVDRKDLSKMSGLKFLYIDNSTVIYIDHGNSNDSITTQLRNVHLMPNDPYSLACQYGPPYVEYGDATDIPNSEPGGFMQWIDDFVRLAVADPTDLTPRSFVALIPKCFSNSYKFVRNATTNFICPIKDPKTLDPSVKQPSSDNN